MPQSDLEYILGYGSIDWFRGTSAQEKSEMPAAAAPYATVIPRKFLTVPGFDHRTFDSIKKTMARFDLSLGDRWIG